MALTGPVHVHVEELVLHGVRPGDRHRVAEAMQAELARLLSGHRGALPLLRETAGIDSLRTRPLHLAAGESPRALGRSVARAVHRAMSEAGR